MDEPFLALQRLIRTRLHLVNIIKWEKTYFSNNLFLKFSSLRQEKIFSNNFGATAMAVMEEFLSPMKLPPSLWMSWLLFGSKGAKMVDADGIAKALQKAPANKNNPELCLQG